MTSSWFSYPHWITMHGQPHIRFTVLICLLGWVGRISCNQYNKQMFCKMYPFLWTPDGLLASQEEICIMETVIIEIHAKWFHTLNLFFYNEDRTVVQADSRLLLTPEKFLPNTSAFFRRHYSTSSPQTFTYLSATQYNLINWQHH